MQTEQSALRAVLACLPKAKASGDDFPLDPARARAILRQLESMLSRDDTASGDLFAANQPFLLATFGSAVMRLGRQMEDFDYPAALATLRELLQRASEK